MPAFFALSIYFYAIDIDLSQLIDSIKIQLLQEPRGIQHLCRCVRK